jgi:hypothetical protein
MRLTIVPIDNNVIKDNVPLDCTIDLSSCAIPSNIRALQWRETSGWIEFWNQDNQDITELPSWVACCVAKYDEAMAPKPPTPPTAEENKITAITLLQSTDWTTIPDVSDPTKSNPYLSNVNDFVTYRNAVRQYALNPVVGNITWPTIPEEVWTSV